MKRPNIYVHSHPKKLKYNNWKALKPWDKILDEYGCMKTSEIKEAYDNLCNNFTGDNLVSFLELLDDYFKEYRRSKIAVLTEIITKSDYEHISIEFEEDGGDKFVDYYLIDEV